MVKVRFGTGETSAIADSSLYQWDYGQKLEIESDDFPAIIEVHFSCAGMTEAIAQTCAVVSHVATVSIPNICLESGDDITAWVFEIEGEQGRTTKTIKIPVIERLKPCENREPEQDFVNPYTELLTEINRALDALKNGDVVAARAVSADKATSATSAVGAQTAVNAQSAGTAQTAGKVVPALVSKSELGKLYCKITEPGIYVVTASQRTDTNVTHRFSATISISYLSDKAYSSMFSAVNNMGVLNYGVYCFEYTHNSVTDDLDDTIIVKAINSVDSAPLFLIESAYKIADIP